MAEAAKREALLAELRVKRGSIKGQVSKFRGYLSTIKDDEVLTGVKVNELTLRLNKVIELSTRLDELQTSIEVTNSDNLESELSERDINETHINSAIATAQSILERSQALKTSPEASVKTCISGGCNSEHLGFKLPQIKISKFDGSYYKWMEFKDLYESLIHNNEHIKPIHKFHYLSSYLEGEASRVIANLEVSTDNYNEAWKLLCDRFSNKRQLITNHLNALFNLDPIQRESDKSLRFLSDHVTKNLRALKTLGQPTEHWDTMLVHLLSAKLDTNTNSKWEEHRNTLKEWPTLDDFREFLKNRADILENLYRSKRDKQANHKPEPVAIKTLFKHDKNIKTFMISEKQSDHKGRPCVVCHGDHRVYDCPTFRKMSVDERWSRASSLKLCHVCLRPDHETRACKLNGCRVCRRRHNTYLHNTPNNTSSSGASKEQTVQATNSAMGDVACSSTMLTSDSAEVPNTFTANTLLTNSEALLSTALIEIVNPFNNKKETVKCLLDSCSQSNYLTEALRQRLQLDLQPLTASNVTGIGNTPLTYKPVRCAAHIKSKLSDFNANLDFLVLDQITDRFPQKYVDVSHLNLPAHIQLADPTFNVPAQIDMLLGVEMFWAIVTGAAKTLPTSKRTYLIPSKLGWLVAGPVEGATTHINTSTTRSHFCLADLSTQMTKFWETEELPPEADSIKNGIEFDSHPIEKHFVDNTYRQSDGRFVVRLPLKDTPDCLGNTFNIAKKRLLNLEKRFSKQPELKSMYVDFINEYRDLGHLSESRQCYTANHLPHHPVMKESESTRLRTVFNASCPTSSGYSINDIQLVGPNIQNSLFDILLRFRQYRYVLSGDIEKQYRQILMNELDRNLQVILWREDEHLPIRSLTLNTVTYGFASSSWLAARCLWQLGAESKDPLVRTIIQNDFYCDDLLTGADSESELLQIQAGVSQSLASGCFNLPCLWERSVVGGARVSIKA
ncbi:uncharacterized protein LOC133534298 [Cydia pomonella]|uniref:uncharacterized protein LOC133534298 n=1 Tax=Cydia pomonella TaxID=82600 RepID=UPI002ADE7C80|nr:uncharacterized protein LOC133534298 [Cydia pomonella]